MALKTNYKDDQLIGERKYEIKQNEDGTYEITDVTAYAQTGDMYGASDINATNTMVNEIANKTSNIDNTSDSQKNVAYAANAGSSAVAERVSNDFILKNQAILAFINNVCTIADERITEDSLADVYFTSDSINVAENAVITVETYDGEVQLTAKRTPNGTVKATIRIRVV